MVLVGSFSAFFFCHFRGVFWSFFGLFLLLFLVVEVSGFFGLYFSSFLGFFLVFFSGVVPLLKWAEIGEGWGKEKKREEKQAEKQNSKEIEPILYDC